jgi:hypothetical protein
MLEEEEDPGMEHLLQAVQEAVVLEEAEQAQELQEQLIEEQAVAVEELGLAAQQQAQAVQD